MDLKSWPIISFFNFSMLWYTKWKVISSWTNNKLFIIFNSWMYCQVIAGPIFSNTKNRTSFDSPPKTYMGLPLPWQPIFFQKLPRIPDFLQESGKWSNWKFKKFLFKNLMSNHSYKFIKVLKICARLKKWNPTPVLLFIPHEYDKVLPLSEPRKHILFQVE